jgi:hypothetical protein
MSWAGFFRKVSAQTGKDWKSIKRYVEDTAIGPDLAEYALDHGEEKAIRVLGKLVTNNRRVRNRKTKR